MGFRAVYGQIIRIIKIITNVEKLQIKTETAAYRCRRTFQRVLKKLQKVVNGGLSVSVVLPEGVDEASQGAPQSPPAHYYHS